MRLVLDTNVLISALLNPHGTPSRLLAAWRRGEFELLVSPPLLAELGRVLARPPLQASLSKAAVSVDQLLMDLEETATLVESEEQVDVVADDATDNRILEASAGGADYIVSGDAHLLRLSEFRQIPVVTPARMLAIFASTPPPAA